MQLRFLRNVTSDGIKRNIIGGFVLVLKTTNDLEILILQRLKMQQEWGIIRHFE